MICNIIENVNDFVDLFLVHDVSIEERKMLVTTKEMYAKAREGGYACIAANFWDNKSLNNYVTVAEEMKQPLVMAFAEAHMSALSLEEAAMLGKYYGEKVSVPCALHLDHGQSLETVKKAIALGFTSVMIDASAKSFEENVRITKEVVDYAHQYGVVVEAEIGHVGQASSEAGGVKEGDMLDHSIYTEVAEAVKFVELTNVDSLAVSIGTAHGFYKGTPVINFERLHELRDAVPVPLILHGGSSSGDENLERCATEGISKINVFSDFTAATKDGVTDPEAKDWLSGLTKADKNVQDLIRHFYHLFHCDK